MEGRDKDGKMEVCENVLLVVKLPNNRSLEPDRESVEDVTANRDGEVRPESLGLSS